VVRAVLPGKIYTVSIDNEESSKDVDESQMSLIPFTIGDKVRFKKSVTNPTYGWQCLENVSLDQRYRREGKITYIGSGGAELYVNVEFDASEGLVMGIMDKEVELSGTADKNYKWFLSCSRRRLDDEPEAAPPRGEGQHDELEEFFQLQSSSAIAVERAFQSGVKTCKFYVKEKHFMIDFTTMKVSEVGGGGEGTGQMSWVGERQPPRPWEHHRQRAVLDDGHWHLLTLIVADDVIAICDGETLPVSLSGAVAEKVQKIRAAKAGGSVPSRSQPSEDICACATSSTVSPAAATTPMAQSSVGDFYPLPTTAPFFIMRNTVTQAEEFRRTASIAVEESFPRRLVGKVTLDYGLAVPTTAATASVEPAAQAAAEAAHVAVLEETSWACKHCGFKANYRFFDQCDECQEKRMERRDGRSHEAGKVRVVFPKSKEAHQLRQKLQGKLRSQFQKELDAYDRGGANPDIL
jgi:hypothetical protein